MSVHERAAPGGTKIAAVPSSEFRVAGDGIAVVLFFLVAGRKHTAGRLGRHLLGGTMSWPPPRSTAGGPPAASWRGPYMNSTLLRRFPESLTRPQPGNRSVSRPSSNLGSGRSGGWGGTESLSSQRMIGPASVAESGPSQSRRPADQLQGPGVGVRPTSWTPALQEHLRALGALRGRNSYRQARQERKDRIRL